MYTLESNTIFCLHLQLINKTNSSNTNTQFTNIIISYIQLKSNSRVRYNHLQLINKTNSPNTQTQSINIIISYIHT